MPRGRRCSEERTASPIAMCVPGPQAIRSVRVSIAQAHAQRRVETRRRTTPAKLSLIASANEARAAPV